MAFLYKTKRVVNCDKRSLQTTTNIKAATTTHPNYSKMEHNDIMYGY
jgi:hypothetical protein